MLDTTSLRTVGGVGFAAGGGGAPTMTCRLLNPTPKPTPRASEMSTTTTPRRTGRETVTGFEIEDGASPAAVDVVAVAMAARA